MVAMHCVTLAPSVFFTTLGADSSALTGKCVKGGTEKLQKSSSERSVIIKNDFLVWEICCITEQKVIPNMARGRCHNVTGLAKYGSFDNLLFTRVTKCVKGEEWENCRDFCLKNMLHHPMECDFRKIESIPHKSQNF